MVPGASIDTVLSLLSQTDLAHTLDEHRGCEPVSKCQPAPDALSKGAAGAGGVGARENHRKPMQTCLTRKKLHFPSSYWIVNAADAPPGTDAGKAPCVETVPKSVSMRAFGMGSIHLSRPPTIKNAWSQRSFACRMKSPSA